ncbi:RRQRL motif-containing zinc-binding protein [Streptomyces sp. SID2119]|uniref:RRQRL motif-containing zinc-binding protein n=1 Tax=Streptomyces sp. SID2119 TaxID=2690253 RepID=UPI0031F615CC
MAAAEPASPPAVRDVDIYADPTGALPVYRWRQAPKGLATRRQLRERRLRPGGQDPVAVIECRGGKRKAWLYEIKKAKPIRPMTFAKELALDKAMAKRQTCPKCSRRYYHCLLYAPSGPAWSATTAPRPRPAATCARPASTSPPRPEPLPRLPVA